MRRRNPDGDSDAGHRSSDRGLGGASRETSAPGPPADVLPRWRLRASLSCARRRLPDNVKAGSLFSKLADVQADVDAIKAHLEREDTH